MFLNSPNAYEAAALITAYGKNYEASDLLSLYSICVSAFMDPSRSMPSAES